MREVPEFVQKALINTWGYAPDGHTPALRFIWGEDETSFANGRTVLRYPLSRQKQVVFYEFIDGYTQKERLNQLTGQWQKIKEPIIKQISIKESRRVDSQGYPIYPIVMPVFDDVMIGEPVWVLEGWLPAQKFFRQWQAARYRYQDGRKVDVLGEPPEGGGYDFIKRMNGKYGAPDCTNGLGGEAIEYVQYLARKANNDDLLDKFNPMEESAPTQVIEEAAKRDSIDYQQAQIKQEQKTTEAIKNVFEPAKWSICGTAASYGTGKMMPGTVLTKEEESNV